MFGETKLKLTCFVNVQDMASGQLREIAAQKVGGEIVLQRMIEEGKAVCYLVNGHQFVRIVEHKWTDITGFSKSTEVGGNNEGSMALGDNTIESLADMFATSLEDAHQQRNDVLDISDARVMRAHVDGLSTQRNNQQQLMLGFTQQGKLEHWLTFFLFPLTRRTRTLKSY